MALPVRRHSNDVTSWSPFKKLDDIHSHFSKLIESTLGETSNSLFGTWTPPVDLAETDDAFIVEAELPEVKAEDVTSS
jgi:HSP20 family protein